jgi:acyl-CoA thioesterase I
MSRIAWYFASGESLYLGTALLLLLAVVRPFQKRAFLVRTESVAAWVAVALIVMACPPFSFVVDTVFLAAFLLWLVNSNRPSGSLLQWVSTIVLIAILMAASASEFSHRRMPETKGSPSDQLAVIGDSISSGIDPRLEAWPSVLQKECGIKVTNLARPGAQVNEAILMAGSLRDSDKVVVIEIGGNDLLLGVSAKEYEKRLDTLLSRVAAPNRVVVMFELPLTPNRIAYGQIQRRMSTKYHAWLIPKRYFVEVISGASATTDGLHLSASGARQMAALVARALSPVLKSCPNPATDLL